MAVPIFWRVILGYSAILVLSTGLSLYSIVQLGSLSNTAKTALDVDNRMIAYEEKLTDAILSEARYGTRFIITQASTLHDQSREFKKDFISYLGQLNSLAESPDIKARLARVQEFHLRYDDLFDQEVQYLKTHQTYAQSRYREEKEKIVERILTELEKLKADLQKIVHGKLATIERAARLTRSIAFLMTLAFLGSGVTLSFVISKSITKPISELRRIMANEREGNFDRGLDFSHIPEIQELADALGNTRRKLHDAARRNSDIFLSMTEQFATPLVSIRERLRHLREQWAEMVTAEQRRKLEILAEESDRLIRLFGRLAEPLRGTGKIRADEDQKSVRAFGKSDSEVRKLEPWMTILSNLVNRVGRERELLIVSARNMMAGLWNTVKNSIYTVGYGKGKK